LHLEIANHDFQARDQVVGFIRAEKLLKSMITHRSLRAMWRHVTIVLRLIVGDYLVCLVTLYYGKLWFVWKKIGWKEEGRRVLS